MSIDVKHWWEDERTRGPTALDILRSWIEDPQKMAEDPVILGLVDPEFGPHTPAAHGYDVLRRMLVRFDAQRDFLSRFDWEAAKTYLGVYGP
jgi:hypothetical protein